MDQAIDRWAEDAYLKRIFWLGYVDEVRVKFSSSIDLTFIGALLSQRLGSGENGKTFLILTSVKTFSKRPNRDSSTQDRIHMKVGQNYCLTHILAVVMLNNRGRDEIHQFYMFEN